MALQEFSLNNEDLAFTSIFDSAALLEAAKDLAQSQLQGFAQSQDFDSLIGSAFGQGRDVSKLRDIWLTGKISFPAIEVRSKSELGGAYGAFSQETGKIYLAQELINRFVGEQKQCIEATSHLFPHFNPYLNKHTLIEINW